ncbi:MAG: SMI1/KNR4 family protein, partial [Sandaracinaceae bacterium]
MIKAERNRDMEGTPEGVVAIASGAHEWLGLDYRDGGEPKIVFQASDQEDLELVADSFEQLLDGLVED